jgi:hypothetical protein
MARIKMPRSEWISLMEYVRKRSSRAMGIKILKCVWNGIELVEDEES